MDSQVYILMSEEHIPIKAFRDLQEVLTYLEEKYDNIKMQLSPWFYINYMHKTEISGYQIDFNYEPYGEFTLRVALMNVEY